MGHGPKIVRITADPLLAPLWPSGSLTSASTPSLDGPCLYDLINPSLPSSRACIFFTLLTVVSSLLFSLSFNFVHCLPFSPYRVLCFNISPITQIAIPQSEHTRTHLHSYAGFTASTIREPHTDKQHLQTSRTTHTETVLWPTVLSSS
jgi:hypothetical protein